MKRWLNKEEAAVNKYNTIVGKLSLDKSVWKAISISLAIIILIMFLVIAYMGTRPRPGYVVEVIASSGEAYLNPNNVYAADSYRPSDAVIRNMLSGFVTKLRSVSSDRSVTSKWLMNVYAMMTQNAANQIRDYVEDTDPVNRGLEEKVEVDVFNIARISESSYQVDWRETVTEIRSAALLSDRRYRAVLQIAFYKPNSEEQLENNPLGLYITDITISSIKEV